MTSRKIAAAATALACTALLVVLAPGRGSASPPASPSAPVPSGSAPATGPVKVPPGPPPLQPGFHPAHQPISQRDLRQLTSTAEGRAQLQSRQVTSAAGLTCWSDVTLQSAANGRYVTTEIGYTGNDNGLLRARATEVGPWELYTQCEGQGTNGQYYEAYLSQANGKYVTTEYGFTGSMYTALRARASVDGTWEHYYTGTPCGDWLAFDLQTVSIGRYVTVELGYTGNYYALLRGRATTLGPWEIFGVNDCLA